MKNQTVAICLLVSFGLAIVGSFFGASDGYYTVVGVGALVFGIWAAVKLFKLADR